MMTIRRLAAGGLCVAVLLSLAGDGLLAQEKGASRVIFLHLRMKQGKVLLIDRTVRAGSLKPSRSTQEYASLSYELLSVTGEVLWHGTMHDPSLRRYEYEDPDQRGTLRSKQAVLDDVEFTLRVPEFEGASRVEFYRSLAPSSSSGRPVRRSIGSITLGAGGIQR
jgi:hypothetical protein